MKKISVRKEDLKQLEQQLANNEHQKHVFDMDALIAKREKEERKFYETAYDVKRLHSPVHA